MSRTPTGRPPGRPRRLDLDGRETVRIGVRLADQTARSIAALAEVAGISPAEWIARAATQEAERATP